MTTTRQLLLGGALCLGISVALSRPAAAQSIGYVLMPAAERVQWDDALAFEDDWLYGGRLGLLFGRHIELQPFYLYRNNYPIDAARSASLFGPASVGRKVDVRNFGANLQINLGRGDFVPFLRGGGSILRLEPDSGEKRDRVAVSAGGGIRFDLGGVKAELFAEQLAFRLNPLNIFGIDSAATGKAPTQRNIAYGASLSIPLSSFDESAMDDAPLSGTSAPIEPFVGRLRYASAQNMDDQDVAGVRAGIDLTPQVGLRGFYWRGVNDDRDGTAPLAGYGGEAQFNLNSGPGVSPFLVIGAGRINYFDRFRDRDSLQRDDQSMLILGGGASFRLSERFRVNAAVRDYVMTAEPTLTDVASTDDLTHNTMISAGLTFSLGGTSASSREEAEMRKQRAALERARTRDLPRELEVERTRELMAQRAAAQAKGDTIAAMRAEREIARTRSTAMGDSAHTAMMMGRDGQVHFMTIPVPTVGEVILRYGITPTGSTSTTMSQTGLSTEQLRQIIRQELGRETSTSGRGGTDTTIVRTEMIGGRASEEALARQLAEMERRISARLSDIENNRTQQQPSAPTLVVVDDSGEAGTMRPIFQRLARTSTRDLRPYAGIGGGGDGAQFIASLRADLGPVRPGSAFRFVPEVALGVGSGSPSILAMANVQYPFGAVMGSSGLQPYVTLGAGVFSPSILAVNTSVGASFNVRGTDRSPLYTYVELQGLNLFDYTRLMVGVTSRR